MSKNNTVARQTHIINRLKKKPATFDEIADYLNAQSEYDGNEYAFSKRTFQRDITEIQSALRIEIKFDNSQKVYVLDTSDLNEFNERILEAYETYNALNMTDKLTNHIHFETRKPQGTEHLNGILQAIRKQHQIKFTYQKFVDEYGEDRHVEPYALKESKNRWYVLAKDLKDQKIKTFALDRLRYLEMQKKKYVIPADFDTNKYFNDCFGIINPDHQKPEDVILSLKPNQGKYIKTLPFHPSQEILIDDDTEVRIRLHIYVTHDLKMELLSLGEFVQVIQPESLIQDLKATFTEALKLYQ